MLLSFCPVTETDCDCFPSNVPLKVRFSLATHRETKEEHATFVEILPDSFEESIEQRHHVRSVGFSFNFINNLSFSLFRRLFLLTEWRYALIRFIWCSIKPGHRHRVLGGVWPHQVFGEPSALLPDVRGHRAEEAGAEREGRIQHRPGLFHQFL